MAPNADDDTIRIRRPAAAPAKSGLVWIAAGLVLALAGAGGGAAWYMTRTAPVQVVQVPAPPSPPPATRSDVLPPQPVPPVATAIVASLPVPVVAPVRPVVPAVFAPPLATEAEILADAPESMKAYRLAPQPSILVLQFGSLAEQARALNRAAALLEKYGFPRDRVLPDAELDSRIRASGADPATFYYGHDYRAADLMHFFALAAEGGIALTPEELKLRDLAGKLGWGPASPAALVSLVRQDPSSGVDAKARATILRHELSHGVYFTTPDYSAYATQFWRDTLTQRERTAFVTYLTNEGYDPGLTDLMVNETQAYLMHTPDQRFFSAAAIGLPEARLAALRVLFLTGMPPGWLRDCTVLPGAAAVVPVRAPRRRRTRPQRLGLVRTIRTAADRRTRLAAAASRADRNSRT